MNKKVVSLTRKFGLRQRLLIGIGLILLISHGFVYWSHREESQALSRNLSQETARVAEKNLRYSFDQIKESHGVALQSLVRDPALIGMLSSNDELRVKELLALKERGLKMSRVWLFDSSLSQKLPAGVKSWARLGASLKAAIGGDVAPQLHATATGLSLIASAPVLDDTGKVLALVAVERFIDDALVARLGDQNIQLALALKPPGGEVRILASAMQTPLDAEVLPALSRAIDETQLRQAGQANVTGSTTYEEQILRFMSLPDFPESRYLFILKADNSKHMGSVASGIQDFVLVLSGALILASGLIFWLTAAMRKKLGEATMIARRTTDGDFSEVQASESSLPDCVPLIQTLGVMREGLKSRERNIMRVAYRDPVTGLPNQNSLQDKLKDVISRRGASTKPIFLLVLAIDQIRDVNDSFGPHVADLLMGQIAERLRQLLREIDNLTGPDRRSSRRDSDLMFSRLSGAQFGIFVGRGDEQKQRALALRLVHCLDGVFEHDGQNFSLSARCGIASFPDHAKTPAALLTAASSAATSAAKDISRISFFNLETERKRDLELSLLNELRRAVSNRQLHLNFQPKVSLNNEGRLMAEAFMRWDHPERGPQNPAQFVSFAEKTGFITELTHWVLESSIAQIAQWSKEKLEISVAVNVTLRDLADPEFSSRVVQMIRAAKVHPNSLTIEVPEESLFAPQAQVGESILILSRFGVRIAVDNFAKAFAHAHRLAELNCAYVKISRSFVARVEADRAAQIMVKAIVELAHSANIRVVAEGVEKPETMAVLRKLGCDEAQGYAISRPLGIEEYRSWIRHQAERFAEPKSLHA
jgi:EAL domain-containing protein (putative c-di-GMP-specific phosphodiesterase class I)/GGDEF domain-containing protein